MKRQASQASSDSNTYISSDEMKPDTTPPPPSSAARLKPTTPKEPSTPRPKKKKSDDGSPSRAKDTNGSWTPEKRAELMAKVIDAGFKQMHLESVASEFEVSKQQITNQFAPSRKGGFRDKAIQAVRGDK